MKNVIMAMTPPLAGAQGHQPSETATVPTTASSLDVVNILNTLYAAQIYMYILFKINNPH